MTDTVSDAENNLRVIDNLFVSFVKGLLLFKLSYDSMFVN